MLLLTQMKLRQEDNPHTFIAFFLLQVGDGTTTVVLLASEFMKEAKPYVEDGVHPHSLIRSYRIAGNMVRDHHYFSFF
jgi:hypothetical protein